MPDSADISHGVVYTPSHKLAKLPNPDEVLDKVAFVRIQWIDLTNTVRCRVVPVSYFKQIMSGPRPSIAIGKVTFGLINITAAPGFSDMGEALYCIELDTLRPCPYAPDQAVVMGHFEEKAPVNGSLSIDFCPRSILRRVEKEARDAQVEFLVGFESEFVLLESIDPIVPVSYHDWTTTRAILQGKKHTVVLEEIATAVLAAGIELQLYHAESAPGQFEVVTGPLTPLAAADAVVHTREIIYNIASKHGLHATFAPRIFENTAGSSAHTHISIHSPSNEKHLDSLSALARETQFLAGVVEHLSALIAFTMPIPASYKRMVDGIWSGGTYACWGTENREAPIRLTNAKSPSSRKFEMKFHDATANPYLALTAMIGAGYNGIKAKSELLVKDIPGTRLAAQLSEDERRSYGVINRLPLTWEEGRDNLKKDKVVQEVFGVNFIEKYLSVNKTLADALEQDKEDDQKLSRLVKFY